jgi:hypothetical protein
VTEHYLPTNKTDRKVNVLGTHHAYQFIASRRSYLERLSRLIQLHSVDLILEEAAPGPHSGKSEVDFFARKLAGERNIEWRNIDLATDERGQLPCESEFGDHWYREGIWVDRAQKLITDGNRQSTLVICGWGHLISLTHKFHDKGYRVECYTYIDPADEHQICSPEK